jgi:AraC-like DNA-binding protein/mannose-6-phosphate isomerase-like protein (cupin superfamily)
MHPKPATAAETAASAVTPSAAAGSADPLARYLSDPALDISIENVFVRTFHRGYQFGPHRHDFVELNYVRDGAGFISFGGRAVQLRTGDCLVIFPNHSHYFEASPGSGATLVQISFSISGLPPLQSRERLELGFLNLLQSGGAPCMKFPARQEIPDCITAIGREINDQRPRKGLYLRIKMLELLVLLSRAGQPADLDSRVASMAGQTGPAAGQTGQATGQAEAAAGQEISKAGLAARLIREGMGAAMDLDDIAARCGLGARGLRKAFAKAYGLSPVQYLTAIRLQKAEILLAETELTLADIAEESGFSSDAYLSRVFARERGLGPKNYRKLVSRARTGLHTHWTFHGSEKYKNCLPPGSFLGMEIPFTEL